MTAAEISQRSIAGIPGTEATASKAGYYYQDLVTALAWTKLHVDQELHVEVAEDYAVIDDTRGQVTQVKHVVGSLTLTKGIEQIERFLEISTANPSRSLSFVYLTTADIGLEKSQAARPGGRPGIAVWSEVQAGSDAAPLIAALNRLAPENSRLRAFLADRSEEQVVDDLIQKVTWAVRSPDQTAVYQELAERVANIAFEEVGLKKVHGRRVAPAVHAEVTRASANAEDLGRILTYRALRDLVRKEAEVVLPKDEYELLVNEAKLARKLPLPPVNKEVQQRLESLIGSRYLSEARAIDVATLLGRDVADDGDYQLADATLRGKTLCWCARVLLEADRQLAESLLSNAERISTVPEIHHLHALLLARTDRDKALRRIERDESPEAELIRYAIVRQAGTREAIDWLNRTGANPERFDYGGQTLILLDLLKEASWDEAVQWLEQAPESTLDSYPAFGWAAAHALTAWASVDAARATTLSGPPTLNELHLRADPAAMRARRRAVELFRKFSSVAKGWGLSETYETCLEYALAVMLEDRQARTAAVADVSRLWVESSGSMRWLPLALRAGVSVDKAEVARKLDVRAARYGSLNFDDARARLALLVRTRPESWLEQWPEIRSAISDHFDARQLSVIYIQALIEADRMDDAAAELARQSELPLEARRSLSSELNCPDASELKKWRSEVEQAPTPGSLQSLAIAFDKAGDHCSAAEVYLQLYGLAGEPEVALSYVSSLRSAGDWSSILSFLEGNEFLLDQSPNLGRLYVDALYRHGRWDDARSAALKVGDLGDARYSFSLRVSISSGNWGEVSRLLEEANVDPNLTPEELIHLAQVSNGIGNIPLTKQLVKRATSQNKSDPNTNWGAYALAVKGNWEDDPLVNQWFKAGLDTADQEGSPVRSGSIEDLMALAPQWRARADELERSIGAGEMFLALAAQQLNRPLAAVLAGTAITNETESDFRRVSPISAYAGVQHDLPTKPATVALDATAMLTLARLGVLHKVGLLFGKIFVPHSIGLWLFTESTNARFHQPGQITDAKRLLHSIARDEVVVSDRNSSFSKALADQVGVDLAQLLYACTTDRELGKQSFVVRPAPLHKVGTFRGELAEVGEARECIVSTLAILRALRTYGGVTDHDFEKAASYLERNDQGWVDEVLVPPGARLYLDDLAVTYLQHVELLKPLFEAKFEIFIHADLKAQAVALGSLEDAGEAVGEVIEEIRRFYVDGQGASKIQVLPLPLRAPELPDDSAGEVSAAMILQQMFEYEASIEAVVIDDRAANRYPQFSYPNERSVPVTTSLDILKWLVQDGLVGERDRLKALTTLRRSGYLFVPLAEAEILAALEASAVHDGQMFESVAAKAIRESVLLARASGMLQLPMEMPWYVSHIAELSKALVALWSGESPNHVAMIKSAWLVDLMAYDGFADRVIGQNDASRWIDMEALSVLRLLMNLEIPEVSREAYNKWLDDDYVAEMAFAKPLVFDRLAELVKRNIFALTSLVDRADFRASMEGLDRNDVLGSLGKQFVNHLPASLRDRIFEDEDLFKELGLSRSTLITINAANNPSFRAEDLYAAASRVQATNESELVKDSSSHDWSVELSEDGSVNCFDGTKTHTFLIRNAALVSDDVSTRLRYASRYVEAVGLAPVQAAHWLGRIELRPLRASEIVAFERDVQCCPAWRALSMVELLSSGSLAVADVAPTDPRYYLRLVPEPKPDEDIGAFSDRIGQGIEEFGNPFFSLVWSSHQGTTPKRAILSMSAQELDDAISANLAGLDVWSTVGLIESLAERPDAFDGLIASTCRVVKHFVEVVSDIARLELTSTLMCLVDSTVNRANTLSSMPVFWRRLASISQAALIERSVLAASVEPQGVSEWASSSSSLFHATTLADLQREPRWSAFMAHEHQLAHEFVGRVLNALQPRKEEIAGTDVWELVFGESDASLAKRMNLFFSALPGPLEGAVDLAPPISVDLLELFTALIDDQDQLLSRRMLAATQIALMAQLPEQAIRKLDALVQELNRQDLGREADDHLLILCLRLSLAAAALRDPGFTNAVRQLLWAQPGIALSLRMHSLLTAAGAEDSVEAWRREVGRAFLRCTTMVRSRPEAEHGLFLVRTLASTRPDLRPAMAASHARLEALAASL